MKLLLSNRNPLKDLSFESQKHAWERMLFKTKTLRIATGFVSTDSVMELNDIILSNRTPQIELFVGMGCFSLFTPTQYEALRVLDNTLRENQRGILYLSPKTSFHGKLYSFSDQNGCFGGIVGSSNLGSIMGTSTNLYEVDCLFDDYSECKAIDEKIGIIISKLGMTFSEVTINNFDNKNTLLDNHIGVTSIGKDRFCELRKTSRKVFDLPLKPTPKSNLNCYFGKGRKAQNGYILPRSWYEVEVIVSNTITLKAGYPINKKFTVITNDGWSFCCETNGEKGKNFRSSDDLKILGKWIKGAMEVKGVLKPGQCVTQEVLDKFEKNRIQLASTSNPDTWLISLE